MKRQAEVETGVTGMCCEFACRVFLDQHKSLRWVFASQNAARQARQGPIQRMPSRALDGGQRLDAWLQKKVCGSARSVVPARASGFMDVGYIFGKTPVDHGSSSLKRYLSLIYLNFGAHGQQDHARISAGPASQRDVRHQFHFFSPNRAWASR